MKVVDVTPLGSKLSGRYTLSKEDVDFSKGETFRLWDTEVCPDETKSGRSSPKEPGFRPEISMFHDQVRIDSPPVPSGRIQHVRRQDSRPDTSDIVRVSREHNSLVSKARGRCLRDNDICNQHSAG